MSVELVTKLAMKRETSSGYIMAYQEPGRMIFQEFEQARVEGAAPLYPLVIGPSYVLHRYSEAGEKASMGLYDEDAATTAYAWPDSTVGGVADQATAVVYIEGTEVRYFHQDDAVALTATAGNRVRASALVFRTTAAADRSAVFGTRDVSVGDLAHLQWTDGSVIQQLTSKVAGFVAEAVAGSTVPVDDPFRVAGFSYPLLDEGATEMTDPPSRYNTAYDASAYNGLISGYPMDDYTVRVVAPDTDGPGGLDGTTLRISSAGGEAATNVLLGSTVLYDVVDGYYAVPLGARGAFLHLSDAGAGTVSAGDAWVVRVQQDYQQVDITDVTEWATYATPAYSGLVNTSYILTVITGGTLDGASATGGNVRIHYRTNNGADITGYLTVPLADFTSSSPSPSPSGYNDYPIGTRDVFLRFFHGTQFNTGDVWTFAMEAEGTGPVRTLILEDQLDAVAGTVMHLSLGVQSTLAFPDDYWSTTAEAITVLGDAEVTSTLLGTAQQFSIYGGTLYASYRELNTALSGRIGYIDDLAVLTATLGAPALSNPLSAAVNHALREAVESTVGSYYMAVSSDDRTGYQEALALASTNDIVYSLVPATTDETVKADFLAHVLEQSNPVNEQWRIAWVGNDRKRLTDIYTATSAGADLEATISSYPGGTYRRVTGVNTQFITSGVRAGDILRIGFSSDGTYEDLLISLVTSEDEVILATDYGMPLPAAVKIEVWRNLSRSEYAQWLSDYPARFNSRRVACVWADGPVDAATGVALPFYLVCAALAGQRAAVPPHAPMTQLALRSVTLSKQVNLSRSEMNTVASGGNWLVDKSLRQITFTRHQITSVADYADFNQREQSKTTNLDHICRDFKTATDDMFGQVNISDDSMSLLAQRITTTIEKITNRTYSDKLGPQMLDATILRLERDPVLRDTVIVEIDPDMPDPLNHLPITFRVR